MAANRRHRRRLAFGMRGMLIAVLAVAVGLGWWVNRSRDQMAAVAAIRSYDSRAQIWYGNEHRDMPNNVAGGIPIRQESRPWWLPASLEARLGRDYFHNVVSVGFGEGHPASGPSRRGDILREVARLRSLQQLTLYIPVSDADVADLAGLRSLKRLDLRKRHPDLTDAAMPALGRLSGLEALVILDAPITDAGLEALRTMPNLESLTLGEAHPFSPAGNQFAIAGEGIAHLARLPNLAKLEIHSAALTGDGLRRIGAMGHLKWLRIKGGSFADDDLHFLAPLTDLEVLEIVGTAIDGTGFRHLSGLSKVTDVILESPNVTDAAVPHLARLPALKSVMIYGTRVTAAGLEEFRAAPRLKQMGLIPGVTGDTKRLKQALPNCGVLNGGKGL